MTRIPVRAASAPLRHRPAGRRLLVLLLCAVWACSDAAELPTDASGGAEPRLAILDGGRSGNPRFQWVAPTVPANPTGTLYTLHPDAEGQIAVEICEWNGTACVGAPLVRFTAASTDPAHRIQRCAPENCLGGYHFVRWATRGQNPARTYRMRVIMRGLELGYADLDLVRGAAEYDRVDRTQYVPVQLGDVLEARFRVEQGPATLALSPGDATTAAGQTVQLTAVARDVAGDAIGDIETVWSSSDPLLAAVDASGRVLGVGVGVATVTARSGGLSASAQVTVTKGVSALAVEGASGRVGGTATLRAILTTGTVLVAGRTVSFAVDGASAGTAVTNASGIATLEYGVTQTPRSYTIQVDFAGDAGLLPASGLGTLDVGRGTATLSTPDVSVAWGSEASLAATLSPALSGQTIDFEVGGQVVGSALTDGTGAARLTHAVTALAPGATHLARASWAGNDSYDPVQTAFGLQVTAAPGALTLPAVSGVHGGTATLTATLSPAWAGKRVTFTVAGADAGTAETDASGVASIRYTVAQPAGSYSVSAEFEGDPTVTAAAGTGTLTVTAAPGSVTVADASGTYLGTVTLAATLRPALAGKVVSFVVNGAAAGSSTTDASGLATLTHTITSPASSQTIRADWAGDGFVAATSGSATLTVGTAATTLSLTGGAIIALPDNAIALRAELRPAAQGKRIDFRIGATNAGFATTDDAGVATLSTRAPGGAGSHTVTAGFGGGSGLGASSAEGTLKVAARSALTGGKHHTCALTAAGEAYCWGQNLLGQLGDGTTIQRSTLTAVAGSARFLSLAAGLQHTCGLDPNGAIYCWGSNSFGQLGDGTTTSRLTPNLARGSGWAALSVGSLHTCALTTTGQAYCWGSNSVGQLGDGTRTTRTVARPVAGGQAFVAISAGGAHTCALTPAGQVYCWGSNEEGQLGDGTTVDRVVPTRVQSDLTFLGVAAGGKHTCATIFGDPHCWGDNVRGQLGDFTTIDRLTPTRAWTPGGYSYKTIVAGANHTCVTGDGSEQVGAVHCWGSNANGQIGDGTTSTAIAPRRVWFEDEDYAEKVWALAAGGNHACVVHSNQVYNRHTLCWGANDSGQIGDGTTTDRLRPTQVAGAGSMFASAFDLAPEAAWRLAAAVPRADAVPGAPGGPASFLLRRSLLQRRDGTD